VIPIGTDFLLPDEKALVLVEANQLSPDYKRKRRFQLVYVVRGDKIAEHRKDLGAASNFKAPQFRIPALFEHTVGELWDMADICRLGDDYAEKRIAEVTAESTLINDTVAWHEQKMRIIRNRTVSGPGYTKQRNGFPRKAVFNAFSSTGTT
jgi:hypothetical protein